MFSYYDNYGNNFGNYDNYDNDYSDDNDIMYDVGKKSNGSIRSLVCSDLLTGVTILSRSAGATLRRYNEAALLQVS